MNGLCHAAQCKGYCHNLLKTWSPLVRLALGSRTVLELCSWTTSYAYHMHCSEAMHALLGSCFESMWTSLVKAYTCSYRQLGYIFFADDFLALQLHIATLPK